MASEYKQMKQAFKAWKRIAPRRKSAVRLQRQKKASYQARLKDKKLNTLEEVRANQIVQKALSAERTYYITRGSYLGAGNEYPKNDQFPSIAQSFRLLQGSTFINEFCKVGGYIRSQLTTSTAALPDADEEDDAKAEEDQEKRDLRDMYIHIKSILSEFRFLNQGNEEAVIDMCIWRVPYNKHSLAEDPDSPHPLTNPQPEFMWHKPFTPYNGLCYEYRRNWHTRDDNLIYKKNLLASKRITVFPNRMIDITGGSASNRQNTVKWVTLKLSKHYKNKGFQEEYEVENNVSPVVVSGSLSKNRYFLSIRTTQDVLFSGVTACKFCRGKNIPKNIIFDKLAPDEDTD